MSGVGMLGRTAHPYQNEPKVSPAPAPPPPPTYTPPPRIWHSRRFRKKTCMNELLENNYMHMHKLIWMNSDNSLKRVLCWIQNNFKAIGSIRKLRIIYTYKPASWYGWNIVESRKTRAHTQLSFLYIIIVKSRCWWLLRLWLRAIGSVFPKKKKIQPVWNTTQFSFLWSSCML